MDFNAITEEIRKFQSGDTEVFNDIYEGTYRLVYGECYGILRSEEDALDLTQDTYLSIYQTLDKLEEPGTYSKWMTTIARNKCLNYLQKHNRVSYTDNDMDLDLASDDWTEVDGLPDSFLEDEEKKTIINNILKDSLSEVQYQTIFMHYYNDMQVEDIAAEMGCPAGTVKTRLKSARDKFKEALERRTGLEVIFWDERLTTVEAHDIMSEVGVKGIDRKKYVDKIAAAIILQNYMDSL